MFAGFLCLYLVTAGRSAPFGDATPMWQAAENLIQHGSLAIDLRWPVNAPPGADGRYYPVAALLAILVHLPGALLQVALAGMAPDRAEPFVAITSQLGPLVLGALVPAQLFRLLRRLGYGPRPAAWVTLLLGLATSIWVYAHRPYSEIVQAACFLFFFDALIAAGDEPTRKTLLRFGFAAALLVNAKNVYFVCLPGAGVHLALCYRRRPDVHRAAVLRWVGWIGLGFAPGLIAFAAYNHLRWGSPFRSGYEAVTTGFWNESILVGLWGQAFSLGKSVFLFSPAVALALFGLRRFIARRPRVVVAAALVIGPIVLLYARYLFWSGDWGWGPRYLVFALPILVLPAAELFSDPPPLGRQLRLGVLFTLLTGGAVQILGNAFAWDDFINVSREAQREWLGRPNTTGTPLAPYPCFSCFEEVYPVQWLPPMQPIAGHAWLLRHKAAGHDWRTAEADAPWKRYTSLPLNIERSYQGAAIDWWPLATGPGRTPIAVLACLLLLLAAPIRPWIGALRADQKPA